MKFLIFIWAFSTLLSTSAQVTWPEVVYPSDILLDIGVPEDKEHLGFGWSRSEGRGDQSFRWISHMEGEAFLEIKDVCDMDLWLRAAPLYLNWKRQSIGLFVNGKMVDEQLCPDHHEFSDYKFEVPSQLLVAGTNAFTLRMGYRYRNRNDRRELSLAVDKIMLRPR